MQLFGGWEVGLLVMMVLLYLGGAFLNPNFFGSTDAFQALLRDSARYAVMAVGMTFVIANKDLDLSVGSTFGLVARRSSPTSSTRRTTTWASAPAIVACFVLGTSIGLINGMLVTILRVPAFIATLTMLFIGRGFVLGLTGGQSILYPVKAREYPLVLPARRDQRLGLQQPDSDRARRRRASAPSCSPRPAGATRPSPPAATSRPRSMPASRPAGCGSAPTCSSRSAPRSPA